MQEMWVQFLGWKDPLEKEMATPVLLPGESQGQSTGSQRVGHNWSNLALTHTHCPHCPHFEGSKLKERFAQISELVSNTPGNPILAGCRLPLKACHSSTHWDPVWKWSVPAAEVRDPSLVLTPLAIPAISPCFTVGTWHEVSRRFLADKHWLCLSGTKP